MRSLKQNKAEYERIYKIYADMDREERLQNIEKVEKIRIQMEELTDEALGYVQVQLHHVEGMIQRAVS